MEKKNKSVVKVSLLVTAAVLLVAVVVAIIQFGSESKQNPKEENKSGEPISSTQNGNDSTNTENEYNPVKTTILYAEADFDENIYDDQKYVELAGPYAMRYEAEGVVTYLTSSDLRSKGVWAEFFYEYFETIKNGDHNKYNSYFFDEYYNINEKKKEFTQQKIYDIHIKEELVNVKFEDDYAWVSQKGLEPFWFEVKYKIRQNNGTFRLGLRSDTYQSQLYGLAYDSNDEIKIIAILDMNPQYQ